MGEGRGSILHGFCMHECGTIAWGGLVWGWCWVRSVVCVVWVCYCLHSRIVLRLRFIQRVNCSLHGSLSVINVIF